MSRKKHVNHTTVERESGYGYDDGTILTVCLTCDGEIIGRRKDV